MSHVFISYSSTDQEYARKLAEDLRQHGFDVWIDDRIDYGDQWFNQIEDSILNCGAFVVVMSPDARKSEWVQKEILIAKREDIPIFPALLKGREFGMLIDIQFVDVRHGNMPGQDFYDRLERVIEPADESGVMVAPQPSDEPPQSTQTQTHSQYSPGLPRGLLTIGAVLTVIVAIAAGAILLLGSGGDDPNPTPSVEVGEAASEATKEIIITDEPIPTPSAIDTATETSLPSDTPTDTPIPSDTPTDTPVPTIAPTLTAREIAENGVTRNADWQPYMEEFDGVEMVLVPAGCFMMGSEDGDEDERPVHEQCFDEPFWIDRYEVTNSQFGTIGCEVYSSMPEQPRNCVTWAEATMHCQNREARLPTEREWEYAAGGPDSLVYPWGDNFIGNAAIYDETSDSKPSLIGSKPNGASWVGALDMSGNLWEWVTSIYNDYPYTVEDEPDIADITSFRTLRGGSFNEPLEVSRIANRIWQSPSQSQSNYGFRCARDYDD